VKVRSSTVFANAAKGRVKPGITFCISAIAGKKSLQDYEKALVLKRFFTPALAEVLCVLRVLLFLTH
jgi:hypothetical protein